ncbi:sensor histidine kinase [Sphingomonas azotifigens]|uniref:sensor histidine kinase n=1 Tax=Sphingomonas azotifigens TaxID=330920 RepID=UPI001430B601|nr:sensor histidine kinase [Sphingomonas azotifigens]
MRQALAGLLLFGLTALLPCAAGAQTVPERTLAQYRLTTWRTQDGAPPGIIGLAQSPDGLLWIAASTGVYRFDGAQFERIGPGGSLAGADVPTAMLAARDGTIWTGYQSGRFSRYRDGALRPLPEPPVRKRVMYLAQTGDGAIWAALAQPSMPLLRYAGGRWQSVGESWGLPSQWLISIHAADEGSLWVTTLDALYRLPPGQRRFERVMAVHGHAGVTSDRAGTVWLADDDGARPVFRNGAPVSQDAPRRIPAAVRNIALRVDRLGNLWGINGEVLFRIAPRAAAAETLTRQDGLTSSKLGALLEDAEGNLWVGSSLGLNRISRTDVVAEPEIGAPPPYGYQLLRTRDGAVFIAAQDSIYRVAPGMRPQLVWRGDPGPAGSCEDRDGSALVFVQDRLLRFRGARASVEPWPYRPTLGVLNCTVDGRGRLWANGGRAGLFRRDGSGWRVLDRPAPGARYLLIILTAADGQVLGGTQDGRLERLGEDGRPKATLVALDDGLDPDGATRTGAATYFTGRSGIYRVIGDTVESLPQSRAPWAARVTGITQARDGSVWMIGRMGIARIDGTSLDRAFRDARQALRPMMLSFAQGLPDLGLSGSGPGAVTGGDGRLWFNTLSAVAWVDPAHLAVSPTPVRAAILAANWGTGAARDPEQLTLPAGTRQLRIRYTGALLSAPDQLRFRYRLDGADGDWVEAGSAREATFTNLSPGHYRFEVQAADRNGPWSSAGATLAIELPPTFLQSAGFFWLCVLGALGLAALLYALRMRQVTRAMRRQFHIRTLERTRIARDLHDTLLQSVQGLMLRFQTVADQLPVDAARRETLEQALAQAEQVVVEARHRVLDLRSGMRGDPLANLSRFAEPLLAGTGLRLETDTTGRPRPIVPAVSDELVRIGEEAIRNAIAHAQATRIAASLEYGARLVLRIADDGIGIPDARIASAGDDHFGLIGMRERTLRVGGTLVVARGHAGGTIVQITVPARRAYVRRPFWRDGRKDRR